MDAYLIGLGVTSMSYIFFGCGWVDMLRLHVSKTGCNYVLCEGPGLSPCELHNDS